MPKVKYVRFEILNAAIREETHGYLWLDATTSCFDDRLQVGIGGSSFSSVRSIDARQAVSLICRIADIADCVNELDMTVEWLKEYKDPVIVSYDIYQEEFGRIRKFVKENRIDCIKAWLKSGIIDEGRK